MFRHYEKKQILHELGDDDQADGKKYDSLVDGIVNNNIKIPGQYYDRTLDEKMKKKNELLDKLSKLMAQRDKYV